MKRLFPILMLFGLSLLLFHCNSKDKNGGDGTVDTVVVRDTITVRDTVYVPEGPGTTRPHISVSAEKMNMLYIGVDNPIRVDAGGVKAEDLNVAIHGSGGRISKTGANRYNAKVSSPGDVRINVSGPGVRSSFPFRTKRIPDPMARLSRSSGGFMGNGEFKAQGGLGAFLDNFDFDATCVIQGFKLTYIPRRQDAITVQNNGARYGDAARRVVNQAKPGDIYLFTDIKARCPGDNTGRPINSLAIIIK